MSTKHLEYSNFVRNLMTTTTTATTRVVTKPPPPPKSTMRMWCYLVYGMYFCVCVCVCVRVCFALMRHLTIHSNQQKHLKPFWKLSTFISFRWTLRIKWHRNGKSRIVNLHHFETLDIKWMMCFDVFLCMRTYVCVRACACIGIYSEFTCLLLCALAMDL